MSIFTGPVQSVCWNCKLLEVGVHLWVVVPNLAKWRSFRSVVRLCTFPSWSWKVGMLITSLFLQQCLQVGSCSTDTVFNGVLLFPPALIIHHSSVVPVWIERSMSLIQEGSCCNLFLRFESVCSKLRPDLKWRSMEVWQDHRLVLITEAFEQCSLPLRRDGREICFRASSNSFSLIWLGPCGRMSLQILAWHKQGLERPEATTVVLQSFVFIHILLTHWQKSAGIFSLLSRENWRWVMPSAVQT